jgi:hypothetical protein
MSKLPLAADFGIPSYKCYGELMPRASSNSRTAQTCERVIALNARVVALVVRGSASGHLTTRSGTASAESRQDSLARQVSSG